jgi:hypothetical protein
MGREKRTAKGRVPRAVEAFGVARQRSSRVACQGSAHRLETREFVTGRS